MKLKIKQIEIEKILRWHFDNSNNFVEDVIFGNVFILCENNSLTAISSNKKISIKTATNKLQIEECGKVFINLNTIYNLITNFEKEDEISIQLIDNNFIVECQNSTTNLLINDINDVFNIDFNLENQLSLPNEALTVSCEKIINCVSPINQTRNVLTGINFNNTNNKLTIIGASNTYLCSYKIKNTESDFNFTIPFDFFKLIANKNKDFKNISFCVKNNSNILFDIDGVLLNCLLLTQQYPKIQILEEIKGENCVVDKKTLIKTLSQSNTITTHESSPTVTFSFTKNNINIKSNSSTKGSFFKSIQTEYSGDDLTFNFNYKNLTTLIKNTSSNNVVFVLLNESSHIFILDQNNKNYTSIIQPLK